MSNVLIHYHLIYFSIGLKTIPQSFFVVYDNASLLIKKLRLFVFKG